MGNAEHDTQPGRVYEAANVIKPWKIVLSALAAAFVLGGGLALYSKNYVEAQAFNGFVERATVEHRQIRDALSEQARTQAELKAERDEHRRFDALLKDGIDEMRRDVKSLLRRR